MRRSVLRALTVATVLATALGVTALPAAAADPVALESIPTPADGVFRMTGSGWGHGRGLSQWGAYQAASEGRTYSEILAFYYPGTAVVPVESGSIRVLLAGDTGRDLVVRAIPGLTVTQVGRDPVMLPVTPGTCRRPATRWRVRASGPVLRLDAYCSGWRKVDRVAGRSLEFASPTGIVGTQDGAVRRGYRGTVGATLTGSRSVRVVNTVALEDYLRAVVPAEVSPSWPVEALRAQAIAARSYAGFEAAGSAKARRAYDVFDSTRSQAYPGTVAFSATWKPIRVREDPRTDAAIVDTATLQVTAAGAPVLTQFSSSNGGVTAGGPLPYQLVVPDPWDAGALRNPRLAWSDAVTAGALQRRFRVGSVRAVEVLGREAPGTRGGRITSLRIVGTARSQVVTGDTAIRAALGVNSSVVTFATPAAAPSA